MAATICEFFMNACESVVVTGGASGIGLACVELLLQRGANVHVIDLPGRWDLHEARFPQVKAFACDVADDQALMATAALIEAKHGPVGALVNSAGILQPRLSPEALPIELWDRVIAIDQRGTYLACVAFSQGMLARKRGAIVNIASITAERAVPLHAYAPAKAAVVSITQCLAAEWGRQGIRVNAVSPGYTLTEALQTAIDRKDRDPAALCSQAAMGRLVQASEVAKAVAFLLSDEASAITGVALPVDAGWLVGTSRQTYGGYAAN
jgi:NAD(P)-dependent dehydrogenase (short-subunit alcohol dehydrogenase family)